MSEFLNSNRNRIDLFHALTPMIVATAMAPTSIAGALAFLLVWALIRWSGHG